MSPILRRLVRIHGSVSAERHLVSLMTSCYPETGEKEFEHAVAISDLCVYLSRQIAAAQKQWERLTAKLDKIGVRLPDPQLILVRVERS